MREPTYYTLAALLGGPLHGYGIMKRARELSEGRIQLTAGTLYTALERLALDGLVTVSGEEIVEGRARRYYRLTTEGRRALDAHAAWLARSAAIVRLTDPA
jgi:PadR family transcriptional regulator, regulatory protein PadR